MVAGIHWHWATLGHTRCCCEFGDLYSVLIGVYIRTFPCMEANYSYAIKNQRGASKIHLVGALDATLRQAYGIRLQ